MVSTIRNVQEFQNFRLHLWICCISWRQTIRQVLGLWLVSGSLYVTHISQKSALEISTFSIFIIDFQVFYSFIRGSFVCTSILMETKGNKTNICSILFNTFGCSKERFLFLKIPKKNQKEDIKGVIQCILANQNKVCQIVNSI